MRADSWPGLVTNASPFVLPPGAAVAQTNLTCNIPGQLQSRGGMRRVATLSQTQESILDCYPYSHNGSTYLIALTATGNLVAMQSPAVGPPVPRPTRPLVAAPPGVCQTNYVYDYATSTTTQAPPVIVVPPGDAVLVSLDGGQAASTQVYAVNANLLCAGSGKESAFDGGNAAEPVAGVGVQASAMCAA